jgi:hypothetical protein
MRPANHDLVPAQRRSCAAIQRLGATPEGVLRKHRVAADGSAGDTAYFSITDDEWPGVRAGLEARLAAIPVTGE